MKLQSNERGTVLSSVLFTNPVFTPVFLREASAVSLSSFTVSFFCLASHWSVKSSQERLFRLQTHSDFLISRPLPWMKGQCGTQKLHRRRSSKWIKSESKCKEADSGMTGVSPHIPDSYTRQQARCSKYYYWLWMLQTFLIIIIVVVTMFIVKRM